MVPPSSLRIPRVRRYSGYCRLSSRFAYRALTVFGAPSHALRLRYLMAFAVLTPKIFLSQVWPLPLSLATTRGISFDFSSSGYLDVSVPRVPHAYLCVQYTLHDSSSCVFPHSDISGSKLICSSPKLFAACHVLRRLPMPRHSPYALLRLNYLPFISLIFGCSRSSCLNCYVFRTFFLQLLELSLLGKICFVLPASFSEKPDFVFITVFSYSSLSCTLIRFSMSIPKLDYFLFIKLYSYLTSFSQIPVKLHEPFLWAQVDSNHRPRAYQARALTS